MPFETAPQDSMFGGMQRQMLRMMEQMQKNFFNFCPSETWTPSVNLYESDTAYIVCVDLSGVDKKEIEVEVANHKLLLRGTRAVPVKPESDEDEKPAKEKQKDKPPAHGNCPKYRIHVMEIDHGPFAREVELPADVAQDTIAATHRNGMLWIELPKKKQ